MSIVVNPELRGAALAQVTAEYITAHPEEWDQGTWGNKEPECGTTACFGGTACVFAGVAEWFSDKFDSDYGYLDIVDTSFQTQSFADIAQKLLGLDNADRDSLFFGSWEYNKTTIDGDVFSVDENTPTEDKIRNLWAKMVELYGDEIVVPGEYK